MLVAALEVDVGRPAMVLAERQHGFVARPRVEPHVEDVRLALERAAAARRARQPGRDELLERPLVPGVGAVLVEHRGRLFDQRRREHGGAARRAVHRRDRHAPGALARDAPVGPVGDHALDAGPAPAWGSSACRRSPAAPALADPRASMAMNHCGRRQEDHRLVAAPAVRVRCGGSPRGARAVRPRPAPLRPSGWPPTPVSPAKRSTVSL